MLLIRIQCAHVSGDFSNKSNLKVTLGNRTAPKSNLEVTPGSPIRFPASTQIIDSSPNPTNPHKGTVRALSVLRKRKAISLTVKRLLKGDSELLKVQFGNLKVICEFLNRLHAF